jgi:hypothetical protein
MEVKFAGLSGLEGSSVRMRIEGVQVSSNCPDRTAQKKPARPQRARARLVKIRMSRIDMVRILRVSMQPGCVFVPPSASQRTQKGPHWPNSTA